MTKRERDLLAIRYIEIEAELTAIAEGRVVDGNPADVEAALLEEQEEIEYRLGSTHSSGRNNAIPAAVLSTAAAMPSNRCGVSPGWR